MFRPAHRQLDYRPGRQGDGHNGHGPQGGGREERRLGPAHGALPRHAHRLTEHVLWKITLYNRSSSLYEGAPVSLRFFVRYEAKRETLPFSLVSNENE
jgi:hypothetical protein